MGTTNSIKKRNLALLLVMVLLTSMFTIPVNAYDTAQSTYFNNKDLPDDILALPSLTVDQGKAGTYTDGTHVVTIAAVSAETDGISFTWVSNTLVGYVFVKGGAVDGPNKKDKNMATLYGYNPSVKFDNAALQAPSGRGISHVTFYFGGTPEVKHGSIAVSKFLDNDNEQNPSTASYELTLKDGTTVVSTASIKAGETVKFDNLTVGKTYALSEATSDLYRLVSIEHESSSSTSNSIDIAISDTDLYHTVNITNKLPSYHLNIKKLLAEKSVVTTGAFGVDLYKMTTGDESDWAFVGTYSITPGSVLAVTAPVGPGQYAVKEPALDGYVLQQVTTNPGIGTITPDSNGYYAFNIPEAVAGQDVTVDVTLTNFKREVPRDPSYGISITKVLAAGSDSTTEPFRIELYRMDSDLARVSGLISLNPTSMHLVGTAVVTPGSTVVYGAEASIGPGTYAVKEQTPTNGYSLVSVSTQGGVLTADSDGYFLFDVPQAGKDNPDVLVAVTVANYKAPPSTNPPSTNPPSTNPPSTNPPSTNPPSTNPPSTNPPSTNPPSLVPFAEPSTPADAPSVAPDAAPAVVEMTEDIPQGAPALPKTGGIPLAMLLGGGVLALLTGTRLRPKR